VALEDNAKDTCGASYWSLEEDEIHGTTVIANYLYSKSVASSSKSSSPSQ
jgi:hypothetical protein